MIETHRQGEFVRTGDVSGTIERLSFVGLGKLGLPLAACFGEAGIPIIAIDTDGDRIEALNAGRVPLEEPGLGELLQAARGSMEFTTQYASVAQTDATIFLLPTPSRPSDQEFSPDMVLAAVAKAAETLASADKHEHCFIISSTIMPGTLESRIRPLIARILGTRSFGLAYAPEFVALGNVIQGFKRPDFVLIGASDAATGERVAGLYRRLVDTNIAIERVTLIDAEIAKVTLNTYLCLKISFANFIGQYCAQRGDADPRTVTRIVGRDTRIGQGYFSPGMAYGGACFPRDTKAFLAMASAVGLQAVQVEATEAVNERQRDFAIDEVCKLNPRSVAILGIAFKPHTPSVEASPSIALAEGLISRGIAVSLFDFSPSTRLQIQISGAEWRGSLVDAISGRDCVVIAHPDRRLREVADLLQAGQRVIDFWGVLSVPVSTIGHSQP